MAWFIRFYRFNAGGCLLQVFKYNHALTFIQFCLQKCVFYSFCSTYINGKRNQVGLCYTATFRTLLTENVVPLL